MFMAKIGLSVPLTQCHNLSVLQCLTLCSTITILQTVFRGY